jgi:pilus assembly protein Flp/PilA
MTYLLSWLTSLLPRSDEEGQGLAEYALILALIAIIAIAALILLGGSISAILQVIGECLDNPTACPPSS